MAAYKIFKLLYNTVQYTNVSVVITRSNQDHNEGIKFTSEFYSSKVKSKRVVRERNVKQHKI